ncbi:MAG: transglycosylase SLT domain-containing protein [Alphaproteobacteria bacterium]|nr:transglycosylase SLT domain-containing protein [Alphaproteobacteria bacterium]
MHWALEPRRLFAAAVFFSSVSAPAVAVDLRPLTAAIVPGALEHDSSLPKFLTDTDATTYRTIFRLQDYGNWIEADRNIARLKDRRLLGHVLAQRYLAPNYRSRYDELSAWLDRYADHPQAGRLYGLALQRMPQGAKTPQAPSGAPAGTGQGESSLAPAEDDATEFSDQPSPGLDQAELADTDPGGDEDAAQSTPAPAAKPATSGAGRAWAGGLAAWRAQRYAEAAKLFEQVGGGASVNPWVKAAGYYWAARAYHAGKQPQRHTEMLQQAAQHPRTFYGILARHVLGWDDGLNFQKLKLAPSEIDALAQQPRIQRAIALSQVWQFDRADHELRRAAAIGGAGPSLPLVALAERIGTPASSLDLAQRLMREEGVAVDTALYPVMPWSTAAASENGIDAALLHALVRQESGFRPRAKSHAGARGLMQLMPATGKFMARETNIALSSHERLFDPPTNLMLGQAYVGHLLRDEAIGSNLFKMTAAYNGGPGNLRKWERRSDHRDDPLLFIESIPSRETRVFIERVLANMWIYRIRFNQSTPSLDALAAGEWPGYDPQNGIGVAQAVERD